MNIKTIITTLACITLTTIMPHCWGAANNHEKQSKTRLINSVPSPRKNQCFTVLKSPHAHEKSKKQFELAAHQRILDLATQKNVKIEQKFSHATDHSPTCL